MASSGSSAKIPTVEQLKQYLRSARSTGADVTLTGTKNELLDRVRALGIDPASIITASTSASTTTTAAPSSGGRRGGGKKVVVTISKSQSTEPWTPVALKDSKIREKESTVNQYGDYRKLAEDVADRVDEVLRPMQAHFPAVPDDVLLFSKLADGYGTHLLQHTNAALARDKTPHWLLLNFRHSWGICSAPTAWFSQMPASGNGPLGTSSVVIRWMSSLRQRSIFAALASLRPVNLARGTIRSNYKKPMQQLKRF